MFKRLWVSIALASLVIGALAGCATQQPATPKPSGQPSAPAAASKWPTDADGIVNYKGADREQMLLEGAKKESGKLTWYTSTSLDASQPIVDTFNKKYPNVKVEIFRADAPEVLQRISEEAKAKRIGYDILTFNGTHFFAAQQAGWLRPLWSPGMDKLPAHAKDKDNYWVAQFQLNFTAIYNTNLIPPDKAPKTYEDLLKNWGRPIAAIDRDYEVFQAMIRMWGKDKAVQFYKDLMKNNKVELQTGRSKVVELVSAGEYPLGMFMHNHDIERFKAKNAPVDWVRFNPTITSMQIMGLPKELRSPNTTILFFDWLTSKEGYEAVRATGRIAPHPDVPPNPPVLNQVGGFYPVLPEWTPQFEEESKLYQQTVGIR